MESFNKGYRQIKPVVHIFLFEITLQIKKFIIFSSIIFFQLFLNCYIYFLINSSSGLSGRLDLFYLHGSYYFVMIMIIAVTFFFSGIICSEYKDKTGLTIIPLVSRYKLILGKFFANLFLVICILVIHYFLLILFGYYFYGGPISSTWVFSFWFAILYFTALSTIVIFFSSIISSSALVIIIISGLTLIGFDFIDFFLKSIFIDFKPVYSLSHLSRIIFNSTLIDFDLTRDYINIEAVIGILLIYIIVFFISALILFKRREF